MPMPMTAFPGDIAVQYNNNGQRVLRFTCHFRHSVERVWQALTDDGQLAIWYPTKVHIQPVTGGTITFAFPGGDPFPGDVLEAAPPHLLVFTTLDDVLRWEIQADGAGSTLVLSNTVANPPHTPYTAAGFHISLSQLTTLLNDGPQAVRRTEMPPPDALVDHYISALDL